MTEGSLELPLYTRISGRAKALLFGCFSVFFFCVRFPQFTSQWDGEDGNGHLSAMLMGLAPPNEMMYSRIDGEAHYAVVFAHPVPPYLFISLFGKAIRLIFPLASLHGQSLIFALKATVTLLQFAVFLALLFLALRYARTKVAVIWLWVLATTPIALYSSNEVQQDSSSGFLFVALFFMGTVIAQSSQTSWSARTLALFVGTFVVGLGKNEWTLCLATALLLTTLAHPLIHWVLAAKPKVELIGPAVEALLMLCIAGLGLACGNYVNYLVAPSHYLGGWVLLHDMIFRASVLSGDTSAWWNSFVGKIPYILFHFIVDASILFHVIRQPRTYSATVLLAIVFANALLFSYVFSSFGSFPRYFAPAFIGLGTCFLIILIRLPSQDSRGWAVAATIILVALQSMYYQRATQYWRLWRGNTEIPAWVSKYESNPDGCVLVVDYSYVLDRPNVDFVHAPIGRDVANQYLASIGRKACPSR